MTRPDRHDLIQEARSALSALAPDSEDSEARERREQLAILVRHLENGVLSPLVLEAVANRVRTGGTL